MASNNKTSGVETRSTQASIVNDASKDLNNNNCGNDHNVSSGNHDNSNSNHCVSDQNRATNRGSSAKCSSGTVAKVKPQSGKRFKLPFFNKKSKPGKKLIDEPINEEGLAGAGRRRTSSVSEKDMEAVRKNSKALAIRRGPHGIEPETQSAPVN